jgi:hypothetical protein
MITKAWRLKIGKPRIASGLCLAGLLGLLVACSTAPDFREAEFETAMAEVQAEATATALTIAELELTSTPTPTNTLVPESPTEQPLSPTGPHGDGIYLVGAEISPGVWRAIRTQAMETEHFCYFSRRKYDGIVLGSYYGLPGPDLIIRPGDYEVELDGCGVWVYMGER